MDWLARHKVGVWAFLVGVAYVPGIMSAAIVPRWAVVALGVPLVSQIRWQIPVTLQAVIAAGFAWTAMSIFRAPDQMDALLQLFLMACLFGVMGAASQLDTLEDALGGLCWGIGVSAGVCGASFLVGYPLVSSTHVDLFPGLFYNSEVLVELCAPVLVWAAAKRHWHYVAMCAVPILVNNSRIAIFCVVIGLLFSFWPKTQKLRIFASILAVSVIVAAAAWFTIGHFKFGSAASRVTSWLTAVYTITPAGYGLGFWRATHGGEEFAHSDVLQSFAEIGLGALLFAAVPFYALRNRRDHAERAAFIVLCIELVVSFPLHVPATGFLAALLAGYLVRERAGLRNFQFGGGDQVGNSHERLAAHCRYIDERSGRGGVVFPLRSSAAVLPAMGGNGIGSEGAI